MDTSQVAVPAPSKVHRPSRRWPLVAALVLSIAVAAVTTVLLARAYWPASWRPHGPGAVDPVVDGSDPNRAGCGPGAVTIEHVSVHFPGASPAGELELRYSPRCHAAWSRFQPDKKWQPGDGVVVTVWTIRPADQATQSYTVPFGGEDIIGNMLMTKPGCILVEVTMIKGTTTSPAATVGCQKMG